MPPLTNSHDELSLRHLPNVSDTSFSFQIPGVTHGINLLAEEDLDFFDGVDVSNGGPLHSSPRTNSVPLATNDLTPTQVSTTASDNPGSFLHQHSRHKYLKEERIPVRSQRSNQLREKAIMRSKPITPLSIRHYPEAESSTAQMTTLETDIDTPTQELHVSPLPIDQENVEMDNLIPEGNRRSSVEKILPTPSRQHARQMPRNNQKITESGVTKSRTARDSIQTRSSARIANSIKNKTISFPPVQKPALCEDLNGDDSVTDMSMGPSGSLTAERLAPHGQNLINYFGMYSSTISVAASNPPNSLIDPHVPLKTTTVAQDKPTDISDNTGGPLTLSQVSPRKRSSRVKIPPTPPANASALSLKQACKRPASDVSESPYRKKSKTAASSQKSAESSNTALETAAPRLVEIKDEAPKASGSRLTSTDTKNEVLPPKAREQPKARKVSALRRSKPLVKSTSVSSSTSFSRSTRILRNPRPPVATVEPPTLSKSLKGKSKAVSSTKMSERPPFQIPPLGPALTGPFQSLTDSRLSTRKGEPSRVAAETQSRSQSHKEKKYYHPIPDYKAMHAAQEAKLALIKENVHPTVPQPIILETDRRILERQRFDDMVKEKQREQERVLEEKRKEREEQEEKELRELRKKTIPKAHIVPEWYKEAPRKKDNHVDSLGR